MKHSFFKNRLRLSNEQLISLATFFIIVIILYLREGHLAGKAYLISEDGTIFIQRAIQNSVVALYTPYAGYYHFFTQLITDILYLIGRCIDSIKYLPHAMRVISVLTEAAILSYFTSSVYQKIIENRLHRAICCVFVSLASLSELVGIYGTLTNIQWWFSFFFFLVILQIFTTEQMPSWGVIIVVFIMGLSTINVVLFNAALAIGFISRIKKSRVNFAKVMTVLIPGCIQIFALATSNRPVNNYLDFEKIAGILPACLNLLGKTVSLSEWRFSNIRMILLGMITLGFIIVALRKSNRLLLILSILYAGVNYAFCILPIAGNENNAAIFAGNYVAEGWLVGGRYWFNTLQIMSLILSISLIKYYEKRKSQILFVLVGSYFVLALSQRFDVASYIDLFGDYTTNYDERAIYYERGSQNTCKIPLENSDWNIYIPSKESIE